METIISDQMERNMENITDMERLIDRYDGYEKTPEHHHDLLVVLKFLNDARRYVWNNIHEDNECISSTFILNDAFSKVVKSYAEWWC